MGEIADAVKFLHENPEVGVAMESRAYGFCGGTCEPKELTRDEWPAHYLDDQTPRVVIVVIGCTKCRQVLRVTRVPA